MNLRQLKRKNKKSQVQGKKDGNNTDAALERELAKAIGCLEQGQLAQAEKMYQKILKKNKSHTHSLHMLGVIAHRQRKLNQAVELMENSIISDPNQPGYHNNLGLVYNDLGKRQDALHSFDRALEQMPEFFEALVNKGNVLRALERHEEALACYERAKQLNPTEPRLYCNIGNTVHALGRTDEAVDLFHKAISLYPAHVESHYSLGRIYQNRGQEKKAEEYYRKAVQHDPTLAIAYYSLALSRKFTPADHTLIATGESVLEQSELNDDQRIRFHFSLGKIYDDCGQYDKAFAHFQKGNSIAHQKRSFDTKKHHQLIDDIIASFPENLPSKETGSSSEIPVFIVGMPRSGTSLVEQIIARHSLVHGAGELTTLDDLVHELQNKPESPWSFPNDISKTDEKVFAAMADTYLIHIKKISKTGTLRTTDKMPYNYLYIGLIARLFPRARIIHCCRTPLDTCLSIYFQHFSTGNTFSFDLQQTAAAYREYSRLMDHWRRTKPVAMLEVSYEELIENLEEKAREIITFCGLEWEEECLSFHKSRRPVETSSAWQVRQPIYTTSRNRWRNYEKFIEPLREALGDLCE